MDPIVKAAMAKWPHVPACYGWLGLDARGQWWMRDDAAQARGSFQQACAQGDTAAKGARLSHERLLDFIARNYAADASGCWYFQNGPQRVFVELQAAPWVVRVDAAGQCSTTMGAQGEAAQPHAAPAPVQAVLLDEAGQLYLQLPQGLGLVHTQDMLHAANALERGVWPAPEEVRAATLPARFGFVLSPQQAGAIKP